MAVQHTAYQPLDESSPDLREAAIVQLRKKRGLQAHALAYLMVNLLLNAAWLLIGPDEFYWPIFPMLGWGIGLAFHAWDVYSPPSFSEERIQREIGRLNR